MRGVAALWVVLFHVWFFAGEPELLARLDLAFKVGWLGVHLFYALSAFLLGGYLLDRPQAAKRRFMKRRFLRIFPAYYAQWFVLMLIGGLIGMPMDDSITNVLGHLLMAFHLPPAYVQPQNGVWWTLPIEFAFYLLLPAMVWAMRRLGPWRFGLIALLLTVIFRIVVFRALAEQPIAVIATRIEQLPGVFTVFVAGLIAADYCRKAAVKPSLARSTATMVAMAAWIGLLLWQLDSYWQGGVLLYLFGSVNAAFIAVLIATNRRAKGWLAARPGVWLGEISYGIYLWHLPVILALKTAGTPDSFWVLLPLTLAPTLLLAALSYRWIERPAMGLG